MRFSLVLTVLLVAVTVGAQDRPRRFPDFAVIASGSYDETLVYSWDGPTLSFPFWFPNSIGLTGSVLYELVPGAEGIKRIDLIAHQETVLPGSELFRYIAGFAVSSRENFAVLIARHANFTDCGLYSLTLPGGQSRTIRELYACPIGSNCLSISPDGRSVLLETGREISLLDLDTNSIRAIGSYEHAAWAPNGKWIAVSGQGKLGLLNPASFRREKSLGKGLSEYPAWSPDSKYLLVEEPNCGPYFFGLSAVDVETGKRLEIKSAHCALQTEGRAAISGDAYRALLRRQPTVSPSPGSGEKLPGKGGPVI